MNYATVINSNNFGLSKTVLCIYIKKERDLKLPERSTQIEVLMFFQMIKLKEI